MWLRHIWHFRKIYPAIIRLLFVFLQILFFGKTSQKLFFIGELFFFHVKTVFFHGKTNLANFIWRTQSSDLDFAKLHLAKLHVAKLYLAKLHLLRSWELNFSMILVLNSRCFIYFLKTFPWLSLKFSPDHNLNSLTFPWTLYLNNT